MNCQLCQRELDAYCEGRLPEGTRIKVEAHLESCLGCSESLQLLKLANKVIDAEIKIQSNPFLVTRIMAGIEQLEFKGESFEYIPAYQKILRPILMSVSLAAAILIGVVVGSSYMPSESTNKIPIELSYLNDAALESVDFYSLL